MTMESVVPEEYEDPGDNMIMDDKRSRNFTSYQSSSNDVGRTSV